ncbi:helix-turn-helix transcriptional regulator [Streptomyces sp. NPDC006976]|uniref:helix-turn-helix domain-containing protein n=1 Tax=Streptomyces sp. NPDC006976 TaxID=3154311 RepID=UPI003403E895
MAERPTGSTVPRRQLGGKLRDLRNRAHLTVRAAAAKLEWSEAKMWRIETGQTALRSLDVQAMCLVYGAPRDLTEALMGLAKETKARGLWHAYGDSVLEGFRVFVALEEAAESLAVYETDLIPGQFQTEGYAREIIRTHIRGISEADLDGRLRLRMERQSRLTRSMDPLVLRVALDEAVLRRPVGGPEEMARQLAHLVYVAGLPNISIRVTPFAAGAHSGMVTGPFVIFGFPLTGDGVHTEPPTVYSDGYSGGLFLDKDREVQQYEAAFADIWEASLDEQASMCLISEVAGSFEKG